MTNDFLIGAIRASRDLHPLVKTELEEILAKMEPMEPITEHGTQWCAKCKRHLRRIGLNALDNYCGRCGQAVDWSNIKIV